MNDSDEVKNTQINKHSISERIYTSLNLFWVENRQFFLLLTCIVFFKSAIADLSSISGASMQPSLLDGDKVWVNKLAYDVKIPFTEISLGETSDPARGDVIIIDSKKAHKRLVKRIVGIPGDTVYMQNNALVINGTAANYEILSRDDDSIIILEELPDKSHKARLSRRFVSRTARSYGPAVVPDGQYFVLGDNRDNSADSRVYSFIPRQEIIGRSSSVVFSLDSENNYFPRSERFLVGIDD
ncbi:MAG: signal peptidase I [SAR86 cluster bacterium]|uniref:Signal peptidase I n=1 Tax=SAR86 cluster bacterium TaxID=2030880 RepID=A0A2A5B9R1_9GAMM|nr:MAG: signal peptidase I [SAR86 cluster bacterium]